MVVVGDLVEDYLCCLVFEVGVVEDDFVELGILGFVGGVVED